MAMPPPPSLLPFGGPRRTNRRATNDYGIQKTNDDAQATKLSCAALGYFKDELLPLVAKCLPSRKPPIINRGTWARHAAMRQITTDFVDACVNHSRQKQQHQQSAPQGSTTTPSTSSQLPSSIDSANSSSSSGAACQVVVLGAGSDSSWFSLRQQGWPLLQAVHFIEVDYPDMVSRKARTILSTDQLLQLLPDSTIATTAPTAANAAAAADGGAAAGQALNNSGCATWIKQAATDTTTVAAIDAGQQITTSTSQPAAANIGQAAMEAAAAAAAGSRGCSDANAVQHQNEGAAAAAAVRAATCSLICVPPAAVTSHVQELSGPLYSLVGADLRHTQQLDAALERAGFNPKLPTLYLSECVLIYMDPQEVQAVLAAAAQKATQAGSSAAIAVYEQTRPDDAFGVIMVQNLEARGCPLRSLASVPTPTSQQQRLVAAGWAAAAAADMAAVYYGGSSSCSTVSNSAASDAGWLRSHWQAERRRIEQLELLDELEEWKLLQEHYCLAIGVTGEAASSWLAEGLRLQQLQALNS